jgi:hypothetical protein
MDQIRESVCPWQAFSVQCDETLKLIGPIRKLLRKWSAVNTALGRNGSGKIKVKLRAEARM